MTRSRKLLPIALAALLLSACELVDSVEVAVFGPHCGGSGVPPELDGNELYIHDSHSFDWDRIDEAIALLQPYENAHDLYVMDSLGALYLRKAVTLADDPAYFRRAVHYLGWAALCGDGLAVQYLSGIYSEGLAGIEKNPELGTCLDRAYSPHLYERVQIAGRVWSCGLRMENLPR